MRNSDGTFNFNHYGVRATFDKIIRKNGKAYGLFSDEQHWCIIGENGRMNAAPRNDIFFKEFTETPELKATCNYDCKIELQELKRLLAEIEINGIKYIREGMKLVPCKK